jgi:hypothetical protein
MVGGAVEGIELDDERLARAKGNAVAAIPNCRKSLRLPMIISSQKCPPER